MSHPDLAFNSFGSPEEEWLDHMLVLFLFCFFRNCQTVGKIKIKIGVRVLLLIPLPRQPMPFPNSSLKDTGSVDLVERGAEHLPLTSLPSKHTLPCDLIEQCIHTWAQRMCLMTCLQPPSGLPLLPLFTSLCGSLRTAHLLSSWVHWAVSHI